MAFRSLVLWTACLLVFAMAGTMAGEAWASPASDFKAAWRTFHDLKDNPKRAKRRDLWMSLDRAFGDVYRANPKGSYAPKALYYQGRVYEELGIRSGKRSDFATATELFQRQATTFPKHDWSDDALYRKAALNIQRLDEQDLAYVDLLLIVHQYPKGDMRPRAETLLRKLDGDGAPPAKTAATAKKPSKPAAKTSSASLKEVRHFSSGDYTRVVLELSGPAKHTTALLKADRSHGKPQRLLIDLDSAVLSPSLDRDMAIGDGLLSGVRCGQFDARTARVVLDFQKFKRHQVFTLPDPYRVVVDVFAEDDAPHRAAPKARIATTPATRPNKPTAKDAPDLVEQLGLTVKTVMIDAGHGGKDPGAVRGKFHEKDIVLKVAKKVGQRLKKQGFKVIYTRTTDVFIPLEKRTYLANAKKADLFISIHVNASRNPKLHGLETYSLNLARTKSAVRVAARENAASERAISDLQLILTEFMLNAKVKESGDLADCIQTSVLKCVRRSYPLENHGTREAPFYVLMGAKMPAVLVELGYLSNKTESRRLRNDHYQNHLADGIVDGVLAYKKKIERYASL